MADDKKVASETIDDSQVQINIGIAIGWVAEGERQGEFVISAPTLTGPEVIYCLNHALKDMLEQTNPNQPKKPLIQVAPPRGLRPQ